MNRTTKILVIAICVLLCGGGAMFSAREHHNTIQLKNRVLPIDNRAKESKAMLWA